MDGKGCGRDNVFVGRLWKSIKYEELYLHAYDSIPGSKMTGREHASSCLTDIDRRRQAHRNTRIIPLAKNAPRAENNGLTHLHNTLYTNQIHGKGGGLEYCYRGNYRGSEG
jgi:hypothetical protein